MAYKKYSPMISNIALIKSILMRKETAGIPFLTACPRCGCAAESWTDDGINLRVRCRMCGYEDIIPHPDLQKRPWRVV
jgi:Zn ribbon nucleic-acid-binding protein